YRVAVLAVAGKAPVVGLQRLDAPDDRRLLADVEVAVAADLRLGVLLLGALLESPDELHLAVQREEAIAIVLGDLDRFRVDRTRGRRLDGRCHLLLSILHVCRGLLPTRGGRA